MGGSVELKLVYTSKVGTKIEVSKYIAAEPDHIQGLVNNKFFKNDPEVEEWARSVIKIETDSASEEPNTTQGKKRPYAYAGASASGTGLSYRWETQPRVNGKFVKKNEAAEAKGVCLCHECLCRCVYGAVASVFGSVYVFREFYYESEASYLSFTPTGRLCGMHS